MTLCTRGKLGRRGWCKGIWGPNGRWGGDGDEWWILGRERALGGRELWVEGIWTGRVGTGWNIEAEGGCLIDILVQGSNSQLALENNRPWE